MKKLWLVFSVLLTVALSGCGGGGNSNGGNTSSAPVGGSDTTIRTQTFGNLTTRVVGTLQPPVVSTGYGASVTGVAGATISGIVQTVPVSAASSKIAFTRLDSTGIYQAGTISPGGGESTFQQITNTGGPFFNFYPAFSPDGTKVAFSRSDGTYRQIYTVNPTIGESSLQQITNGTTSGGSQNSVFSPDGTKIAFERIDASSRYQIYTISVTGGEATLQKVTNSTRDSFLPSFSPDGTKIAFRRSDGTNNQIYTISATAVSNETTLRQVTFATQNSDYPTFSPDGTRIAFFRNDGVSQYQIYTITPTGGENTLQKMTTNTTRDSDTPSYSPDGSKIAFQRTDGSHLQIYTVNALGGEVNGGAQQVTNGTIDSFWCNWGVIAPVNLVGTGGLLGTNAAGLLFSQKGNTTAAVLVFDSASAANRANARVTALTGVADQVSPNLLFQITVPDALSRLAYQNNTGRYPMPFRASPTRTTPARSKSQLPARERQRARSSTSTTRTVPSRRFFLLRQIVARAAPRWRRRMRMARSRCTDISSETGTRKDRTSPRMAQTR